MDGKCRNCEDRPACVPFFEHENVLHHYNRANRRMLIALCVVCVTFIMTIIIFVGGYTQREKNWLDMLKQTGVTDGIHEHSGQAGD